MKRFKALITDVDGTLIVKERYALPSKRVVESVRKASSLMHVGVATSRPYYMMADVFSTLSLKGPSAINGGAQVINAENGGVLWKKNIQKDDFLAVAETMNDLNLPFVIQEGQSKDIFYTKGYTPSDSILELAVVKLNQQVAERVQDKLSSISNLAIHIAPDWENNKFGVIITHAQATKQHAIFQIAKILKIDTKDIIGVGDGMNDFPLLMACGLKVAMGDAPEDLKDIADIVVPTADEDGLVEVINKFVI